MKTNFNGGCFYGKQDYTNYEIGKQRAIDEAQKFQRDFENHNYSYGELAEKQAHFEKLAKRYGLIKDFRENGII